MSDTEASAKEVAWQDRKLLVIDDPYMDASTVDVHDPEHVLFWIGSSGVHPSMSIVTYEVATLQISSFGPAIAKRRKFNGNRTNGIIYIASQSVVSYSTSYGRPKRGARGRNCTTWLNCEVMKKKLLN